MKKLILICTLFIVSKVIAQPTTLFYEDYETYNLNRWSWRDLPGSWSMVQSGVDSGVGGAGTHANRITLYKSDPLVSNNHRAELVWNSQAYSQETVTGVHWIDYWFKLPTGWVHDINHPESLINIHDGEPCANAGTNPQAFFLQSNGAGTATQAGYWIYYDTVAYCSGGSSQIKTKGGIGFANANTPRQWFFTNVSLNTWHHVTVYSNWDPSASGRVMVWYDDTLRLNYTGKAWFLGTFAEPYIKFGDYKYSWTNETAWGGNSLTTSRIFYNDKIKLSQGTIADSIYFVHIGAINQPPTANAGGNKNIQLPVHQVSVSGAASTDPDGTVSSYAWSIISKPSGSNPSITSASSAITVIGAHTSGRDTLEQGTTVVRLTVTDNGGATSTQDINIVVNAAANFSPVANAGPDVAVTLPGIATLLGNNSRDPDGTISTYAWSQISGPNTATIETGSSANTSILNAIAGTYVFRLTVTDNSGATATDDVTVTVNPRVNIPPIARAGGDTTIMIPTTSVTLNGSGSTDPDSSAAVTFLWTQTTGPINATISSPTTATPTLSALTVGTYTFKLTVTDVDGAQSSDVVVVTVVPATVPILKISRITVVFRNGQQQTVKYNFWNTTPVRTITVQYNDGTTQTLH